MRVAQTGKETLKLIKRSVDDVITVSTDEICAAVKDIFEDSRAIAEPAGALAVAGMKKYAAEHKVSGATMAATVSGANTNFDRLRYISERTEIGERREVVLSVTIPERPGAFKAFCSAIGRRNVTEFNYRYETAAEAKVFVGLTVMPGDSSLDALQAALRDQGYGVLDLTDNETAKLHLRHMVGGRLSEDIEDEMVFRVEFPERPGSLLQFLNALGKDYSISLFHYRNHGAAYGRILVGMQVRKVSALRLERRWISWVTAFGRRQIIRPIWNTGRPLGNHCACSSVQYQVNTPTFLAEKSIKLLI